MKGNSKTRQLVKEIENRGSMRYTEMQYFLWNYDHVKNLRPESKPSRGYWSTNLLALKRSGVIYKGKDGKYTVPSGASNWETFYDSEMRRHYLPRRR